MDGLAETIYEVDETEDSKFSSIDEEVAFVNSKFGSINEESPEF